MTVIDCHTHVFNMAFVPAAGVLLATNDRITPAVAVPLARALGRFVKRQPRLPGERLVEPLVADGRGALSPVEEVVRRVGDDALAEGEQDLADAARALDLPADEPRSLAVAERAGGGRRLLRAILEKLRTFLRDGDDWLWWLGLMLEHEVDLASAFLAQAREVDLFVHHMMDMDHGYEPYRSTYPLEDASPSGAVARMKVVAGRQEGRLLGFVPFNPLRPDSLALVRRALDDGYAGVKFYPPTGYRPWGNDRRELDRANADLYRLCVERHVPLLAHCSPGGMEARPGHGLLADPFHWREVLSTAGLGDLRLCLAHAGGADGWFAPPGAAGDASFEASWAREVVALCTEYPNVYCDFSHHDEVLLGERREAFRLRLERAVAENGGGVGARRYPFATKILYGSDWHMLARIHRSREFLATFRRMFADSPVLRPHAERFFARNAVAFLNLREYLASHGAAMSLAARDRLTTIANG